MAEQTSKRIAEVYAESLYDAACGRRWRPACADVESLQETLQQFPAFAEVLAAPEIDQDERERVLRRTFEGHVAQLTLNFLLVLNQRWRLASLKAILDEYIRMDNDRRMGRQDVCVISAVELDELMLGKIRQTIAAWGGFQPVLHVEQDPSLLAGLVIQVGDRQIDASVQGQLERLREQIKKTFAAKVAASD